MQYSQQDSSQVTVSRWEQKSRARQAVRACRCDGGGAACPSPPGAPWRRAPCRRRSQLVRRPLRRWQAWRWAC
eukprot:scaffold1093_cov359-Prasinococcus_capsulatus_cf.AAC.6